MKILNLFSGIGGNRSLWGEGHEVTAVEFDPAIAAVYKARFPNDHMIVGDALASLESVAGYFDFIWASPPCQSHGQYRHRVGVLGKGYQPIIPDMTGVYGTITFLKTYYKGLWVVENTEPYYEPLIKPSFVMQRHLFWSNFPVDQKDFAPSHLRSKNKISDFEDAHFVVGSKIKNKRQALRNCVDPEVGAHVLRMAEFARALDAFEQEEERKNCA